MEFESEKMWVWCIGENKEIKQQVQWLAGRWVIDYDTDPNIVDDTVERCLIKNNELWTIISRGVSKWTP